MMDFLETELNDSRQNVRNVMRQTRLMASGAGVEHPHNDEAPLFMQGVKLSMGSDCTTLIEDARAWLREWGRDKSNGWLLTHPLKKMLVFQSWQIERRKKKEKKKKKAKKKIQVVDDDNESDGDDDVDSRRERNKKRKR